MICHDHRRVSHGWWFGTSILFAHILGIIIPIDFHIFQRGSNHQPVYVVGVPPKIVNLHTFHWDGTWAPHGDSATQLVGQKNLVEHPIAGRSDTEMKVCENGAQKWGETMNQWGILEGFHLFSPKIFWRIHVFRHINRLRGCAFPESQLV